MKAVTITALMALFVAIPFFVAKKSVLAPARGAQGSKDRNDDLRYDIDDFLT